MSSVRLAPGSPGSRTRALSRLAIGVIWIPLQLVIIPIVLLLQLTAGLINWPYWILSGESSPTPRIGVPVTVFADRVMGWNNRNLVFILTAQRRFQLLP